MVTWNVCFNWTTVLPTLRVTCVSVSESPVFVWYLFRPSQPVSSLLGDVSRTAWQHSAANPESHVFVCVGIPSVYMKPSSTFSTCFFPSARCFANGMTTQCCQPWESRVCLCRKPQCLYDTFFDLRNLFLPSWEMFCERHDNTVLPTLRVTCLSVSEAPVFVWYILRPSQPVSSLLGDVSRKAWQHCDPCFSHGQLYVACSRVGNPTNIYIPAHERKTKELQWHSEQTVTFQFLYMSLLSYSLSNKTFNSLSMLTSSSCTCVLLRKYWTLSYVTWRTFHSGHFSTIYSVPLFFVT